MKFCILEIVTTIYVYHFIKVASPCASTSIINTGVPLSAILGGTARIEGEIKPIGDGPVNSPNDLRCYDWTNICRWRNEIGAESRPQIDELDWVRASGRADPQRLFTIFGTNQLPGGIDSRYAVSGTWRLHSPGDSAMLVSDPVSCQMNSGQLSFQYWTSPETRINVCIRRPNTGRSFVFCSPPITDGDPGPITVAIPGPINFPFEIVISASGFTFSRGAIRGGIVILDSLDYNSIVSCNSAIAPPPVISDATACQSVTCSFESERCTGRSFVGLSIGSIPQDNNNFPGVSQARPGMCYYQAAIDAQSVMRNLVNNIPNKIYTSSIQSAGRKWVCDIAQVPPVKTDADTCWTLRFANEINDLSRASALYCC